MAITKKTLEQIKAGMTPERIAAFNAASKRRVDDSSDPDALTPTDEMWKSASRPGRPRKEKTKELYALRLDDDVVHALKSLGRNHTTKAATMLRGSLIGMGLLSS
jgi:uncharacterized protein (DUF4415 family)